MSNLAIVVHINGKQSPLPMVSSIIAQHKFVRSIHFIYPNVKDTKTVKLYDNWLSDRKQLEEELKIKVHFDAWLQASNFDKDEIIVEVPYDCTMYLSSFEKLKERETIANEYQTEFGIKTSLNFTRFSFAHGYLMILFVIQLFVSRFFNKKIYNETDIRARFLVNKGKTHYLPVQSRILSYIYMPYIMPYVRENAVIHGYGWSFVTRYLRRNRHLGFGMWILFYFPFYVFLSLSAVPLFWITFDVLSISSFAIGLWLFQALLGYILLRINVENDPLLVVYALLYPVYWITFWPVLLYSKFSK